MSNIKFTRTIVIKCSSTAAFDYTQDYGKRLQWDTFLKKAELTDGATEAGKGIKAYCVARNELGMVTEYVSFNRPRVTAIKMTSGPYMFRSFMGSWTFKELTASSTEIHFLYSFSLRFPFNLAAPFIKRNLQNNVQQRLNDLKHHLEQAGN